MSWIRYVLAAALLASTLWAQSPAPPASSPDASAPPAATPPPDSTVLIVIKKVQPDYPAAALPDKLQGQVIVRVVVDEDGDVESTQVISGNPVLAQAAVDAVKQWKFKPFIRNGQAVKAGIKFPFDFAPPVDAAAETKPKPTDSSSAPAKADAPAASSGVKPSTEGSTASDLTLDRVSDVEAVLPPDTDQGEPSTDMVVKIHISEVGDVEGAELVSGSPALSAAALSAAKQWKFKPFLRSGKPVKVSTVLPVVFAPSERESARKSIIVTVHRDPADAQRGDSKTDSVPAPGDPAKRIHVSPQIMTRLVVQRSLSYPSAAKRAKIEGTVVLKAIISKEGVVEDLQPVSGPEQLLDGSMKSVRQWKYRPFVLDDQPVEVETTVTVNFNIAR